METWFKPIYYAWNVSWADSALEISVPTVKKYTQYFAADNLRHFIETLSP